jgi:hypothetical protein
MTMSCLITRIPKGWEERGETIIRTISRQRIGGATEKKDQTEWSDLRPNSHSSSINLSFHHSREEADREVICGCPKRFSATTPADCQKIGNGLHSEHDHCSSELVRPRAGHQA